MKTAELATGELVLPQRQTALVARTFLEWLETDNLFVARLDDQNEWYRYHHLFQKLLQEQLNKTVGASVVTALHRRASNWYAENAYIDEALDHALAAGDVAGAAQIVEQNRRVVLVDDKHHVLTRWLDPLPESWSDRLGGIVITHDRESGAPATVLCGPLMDQAALLGVLNALYGLHLPILSVEHLGNE